MLDVQTSKVIIRRNTYFNERHFPARKQKLLPNPLTTVDTGTDLIGVEFEDDGTLWTVTKTGLEMTQYLFYTT